MNYRICLVLILAMASIRSAAADEPKLKIEQGKTSLHVAGKYLDVEVSLSQPQFLRLAVDSLGQGRFQPSALRPPPAAPRPTVARRSGAKVEYMHDAASGDSAAVDVRVRRKEDHDGFAVVASPIRRSRSSWISINRGATRRCWEWSMPTGPRPCPPCCTCPIRAHSASRRRAIRRRGCPTTPAARSGLMSR